MTIKAKIVCDSVAENGVRLTTFVLSYPRFIHAEFMTHRVFSRNASSSRAIPIERQIKEIKKDMAMPVEFRRNQRGMQAAEAYGKFGQKVCRTIWKAAGHAAILFAKLFIRMGVHKQYANRLLEPFSHISVIVSATQWSNFFALRYHHAAQPEIRVLAEKMWDQYTKQRPRYLTNNEWHLPFVDYNEVSSTLGRKRLACINTVPIPAQDWLPLIKKSVARCARVSYLNHDGTNPSEMQDFLLYERLLGAQPIHASPAEHQATPLGESDEISGNFHGWKQYRKTLQGENITEFNGPLED
jgi:hypothetical protein